MTLNKQTQEYRALASEHTFFPCFMLEHGGFGPGFLQSISGIAHSSASTIEASSPSEAAAQRQRQPYRIVSYLSPSGKGNNSAHPLLCAVLYICTL